jgi:phage terminase small subunit
MSGVKGRSGGPRANSGGKRDGAGRKPSAPSPEVPVSSNYTPKSYLDAVVRGDEPADAYRIQAAKALLSAEIAAKVKDEKPVGGRFRGAAPPKLVVSNG